MSGYYDDEEPRRHRSHRSRRPVYEEEVVETRKARGGDRPSRQMELVQRRGSSSDSVEEVRRTFPPPDGTYVQRKYTTRDRYAPRARSAGRDGYSYEDDRYSYYDDDPRRSDPAVGRRKSRRNDRRSRYESDSESESRSPPPRHRRKSFSEQALEAVGLGGAAAALTKRDNRRERSRSRPRNRSRGRYDSESDEGPRDRSLDNKKKFQQAAKAAITAGAIEAWRSRKEPGGLAGQGKRIITAAVGAAGVDGALDRDPDKGSTRHVIESAIGGLAGNHLINGSREKSRSRSRSRGRGENKSGNFGTIASAAAVAGLAGKAVHDYRSKSRGRRERSDSRGSSRSPSPTGLRKRSKSVTDFITRQADKGMAALGLGPSENHQPKYARDRHGQRRYDDDGYDARPRGGGAEEEEESGEHSDDTDSYSSENEMKKHKKLRGKEYLTAGLATVATIHAISNVHQSMEKGKVRHKKVMQGKMSPEEARRLKSKALLQDAASIGIATLGIKGAISEWKELKEHREEAHHCAARLAEKREHRRQKLLEQQKSGSGSVSHRSSEPDVGSRYLYDGSATASDSRYDSSRYDSRYDSRYESGPRYTDDNPYSMPPTTIGSGR